MPDAKQNSVSGLWLKAADEMAGVIIEQLELFMHSTSVEVQERV